MAWQLSYRCPQSVPVEVKEGTPDQLSDKTLARIERLPVLVGDCPVRPVRELVLRRLQELGFAITLSCVTRTWNRTAVTCLQGTGESRC
jgi:hypothetical protein